MNQLKDALHHVLDEIQQACDQANRDRNSVQLLAVSKTHPSEKLKEMFLAGQKRFGENYLQEALDKIEKLKEEKVIEKKSVEKQEFKPIKEVEKVVDNTVVEKTKTEEKQLEVKPIIDDKKDYLDKHLAQIRELINKNVKYPSKAKKLSIEGIVIVKFKILEDGTVQNIEIIQGDKFLQTSTIEAIEEASKNFPKTNQNIEIQVPIEYKLI